MRKMQYILMPLEKISEGTKLQCSAILGELSGRLHSYTDDILYILGLVRIVIRVSRTIDAKRCQKMSSMPDKQPNATMSSEYLAA